MKKFLIILATIFLSSCSDGWNYEGMFGPDRWSELKEENKFCKVGYSQSPIDIKEDFIKSDLEFFYEESSTEKHKKNYVLQVEFDSREFVMRGKKKYYLRRYEFHRPSEHLVDGKVAALEMQIYNKSDDEQWLVVSIFLQEGAADADFNQIIEAMKTKKKDVKVDLSKIVNEEDQVFFYEGSLSVPPCTEGMKWYVMKTPVEISKEQMNEIIKYGIFVKANARPVQKFHPEKY